MASGVGPSMPSDSPHEIQKHPANPPPPQAAAPAPIPQSEKPLTGEEAAKRIIESNLKRAEAFVCAALLESQKNGACKFSLRFGDIDRFDSVVEERDAYAVDLVRLCVEKYKYSVDAIVMDMCSNPKCTYRSCTSCDPPGKQHRSVHMSVSLSNHLKTQVDAVKKRWLSSATGSVSPTEKAAKKPARRVVPAQRPAAAGEQEDLVEIRVMPSADELAVAVPTETPDGGFQVGDESGNCIVCMSSPASVMLLPCMHSPCCGPCTDRIVADTSTCPTCRVLISTTLK